MSKLFFTSSKTSHSIGYIGGGADHIPLELWPKVPNSDAYQTHLFTLYSDFLPENVFPRRNYYISVFQTTSVELPNPKATHSLTSVTFR